MQPLRRAIRFCLLPLCCGLSICSGLSCAPGAKDRAANAELDDKHLQVILETCKTPQEREYTRFAFEFAQALVTDDFQKAYRSASSHLQTDQTLEQFEAAEKKSREMFGVPLRIFAGSVNTNPLDLAGPMKQAAGETMLAASQRQVSAIRAVGEIPDDVPINIRKASVTLEIERDPSTIPEFEAQTGINPERLTENDRIISYLTMVIVEEGTLGVAYYFYRWPDIWDQEANSNPTAEATPHPSPTTSRTTPQSVLEDDAGRLPRQESP